MSDTETVMDDDVASTSRSRELSDPRLEPICSFTLTTLRLKQDKWLKMMANESFRFIVLDFLNNSQRRLLVMILNPAGYLIPKIAMSDLYHNYAMPSSLLASLVGATGVAAPSATTIYRNNHKSNGNPNSSIMVATSNTKMENTDELTSLDFNAEQTESFQGRPEEADQQQHHCQQSIEMNTITKNLATTAALVATPLLIPLPPPSSSFSTLDGVPRGKCAYFLRRELNVPLTLQNFHEQILCGDFPVHSKIESLAILFGEVLQPLLENPFNRKLWPSIVGKDITAKMKDVRNTLAEIKGRNNNRTILSLLLSPKAIEEMLAKVKEGDLDTAREPKFRNILEEMFINWITLMHEILQEKSICVPLSHQEQPSDFISNTAMRNVVELCLPAQEINFWLNRAQNLKSIYEQLKDESHKALAYILEAIESSYNSSFISSLKKLVLAWKEAEDISLWLHPLQRQTAAFNSINFINSKDLIIPLIHFIHLIWSNSRFYRSTERISVLLKSLCNLLVHRASEDLEFPLLFQIDADEGLAKIEKTIEILEFFKSRLLYYKDKYGSSQTVLPALPSTSRAASLDLNCINPEQTETFQLWRFCPEEVFDLTLDGFLNQLSDLKSIFDGAVSFQSLEKLEVGGLRGKILTDRLRQVHNEFKLLFQEWSTIDIDFTLRQSSSPNRFNKTPKRCFQFKREQALFFERIDALEKKLATILMQTIETCYTWEHLVKMVLMFSSILYRESILSELKVSIEHILNIYDIELQQLEMNVGEVLLSYEYQGLNGIPVEKNWPPVAGALMWLEQHMKRCDTFAAKKLNDFIQKLVDETTFMVNKEELDNRRNILITKLINLHLKVCNNWNQSVDRNIEKGLGAKVMFLKENLTIFSTKYLPRQKSENSGKNQGKCFLPEVVVSFVSSDEITFDSMKSNKESHSVGFNLEANRKANMSLEVNFSIELFTLLKETKYLLAMQHDLSIDIGKFSSSPLPQPIPESLLELYSQRDVFWQRCIKLIKISEYYNDMKDDVASNPELELLSNEIEGIEKHLTAACNTMTWKDYDMNLVQSIFIMTQKLYFRLQQSHKNIESIINGIRKWSEEPLHQRSIYGKNLLEIRHQQKRVRLRLIQCNETKSLINHLLISNFCLFFNYPESNANHISISATSTGTAIGTATNVVPSLQEFLAASPETQRNEFGKYLKTVDNLIRDEVRYAMKISLEFLYKEMTMSMSLGSDLNATLSATAAINGSATDIPHQNLHSDYEMGVLNPKGATFPYQMQTFMPLFEVKLELKDSEICFSPSFNMNDENNFQQIVEQLLKDIEKTCNFMPNLLESPSNDYTNDDDGVAVDLFVDDCGDSVASLECDKIVSATFTENSVGMINDRIEQQPQWQSCTISPQQEIAIKRQLSGNKSISTKPSKGLLGKTKGAGDDLQHLKESIRNTLEATIQAALSFAEGFHNFSFLWTQRQKDVLAASLTLARENATMPQGYAFMEVFKKEIDRYNELHETIDQIDGRQCISGWLAIDVNPLKYALLNHSCKWANSYKQWLLHYVKQTLKELNTFIETSHGILQMHIKREDFQTLLRVLSTISQIKQRSTNVDNIFKPLRDIIGLLKTYSVDFSGHLLKSIDQLPTQWKHLKDMALAKMDALHSTISYQQKRVSALITIFSCHVRTFTNDFSKMQFFQVSCENVYQLCDTVYNRLDDFHKTLKRYRKWSILLGVEPPDETTLTLCVNELKRIKQLWDFVRIIESCIKEWHQTSWLSIDTDDVENECKKFTRDLRTLDKSIREWAPYIYITGVLKELVSSLKAVTELQNPALAERHWLELMQITKMTQHHDVQYLLSFKTNHGSTLADLLHLKLHHHEEDIKNTVDRAIKEMTVTRILDEIHANWSKIEFELEGHQTRKELQLLRVSEELIETLDDNQMQLQNIATSKHIEYLLDKLTYWQRVLGGIDTLINNWFEVQRKWVYLENIFIGSADIRAQLPQDAEHFEAIDNEFTNLLQKVANVRVVMQIVLQHDYVFARLKQLQDSLSVCEKALNDYLETKRLAFPRFYFISSVDLLDILSNGNNPRIIERHLIKLFDSIQRLEYEAETPKAIGMHSKENDEHVAFIGRSPSEEAFVFCSGRVEIWLNGVIKQMRQTLHELFRKALHGYVEKAREKWLKDWPAQVALCGSQICWTTEVNRAFAWIEEGYENALKDLHKRQSAQLNALINLLLGDMTPGDRQKIMTICTIDVHSRDVVGKIIQSKVDSLLAFQWQSQLRHRWDDSNQRNLQVFAENQEGGAEEEEEDCFANICDAEFRYAYEYLGNTSRLVITPLTDRCYITLTQSLHLVMGGAPAGPAGTGKTETTKDLGRALGVMVYVFNCSEQMDYKSCGNIYKGLAQTGAWGCFDEFNRIAVEVLSVVAVQVKTIQEAIKQQKRKFLFMGEMITLKPTIGIFITMNPGYAGRTELPENLKTLFRPCAMIVPDFALICEIMLMAEGFQDARLLARKFITLYTLCKELLSKQDHYDWGLRAIKSVLVVAGTLKRDDHSRPEDQVLMRALRDFNIPKIVTEDVSIFMGLIGDLFPALDVPRKRLFDFEKTIRKAVNEIKLQPEESFLMKVVQLQELLDVRHSVFIVGHAGTGKTKIWQTLLETYRMQKLKPICSILNPKALSNDELFGIVNPTTREWKDGLFSSIMRDQANMPPGNPKWIVLDGDIDPMWIESLNTLMDDNKILTLASNERISLKKEMRLLFEVGHLKAATPATVSRAGILYINPQDLGWSPFVSSWLETRTDVIERGTLTSLFEKYFPSLMQRHRDFRYITPISNMALIQMTCYLLEALLAQSPGKSLLQGLPHPEMGCQDAHDLALEIKFVYATMWAFGSALHQDHITDWRREFHKWWTGEFKDVKLPLMGCIFDYHLDLQTLKFQKWSDLAAQEKLESIDPETTLQNVLVSTVESVRLSYFLRLLMEHNVACMLVGTSGCGKGAILREIFSKYANIQEFMDMSLQQQSQQATFSTLTPSILTVQTTYFNFYTSSEIFQKFLDRPLEKKSGRCYAPNGSKRRLFYFINDLNMPEVDTYGTVQAHTIIRQFMDYKQWYDRQRLLIKDIRQCQFIASMNPTAGSFTIDPRLQRHFCVFSVAPPAEEALHYIYNKILSAHLDNPLNGFSKEIRSIGSLLVQVGISLHKRVEYVFAPTAIKFHYAFNLRDLTNIYQGLLNSTGIQAANLTTSSGLSLNGPICSKPSDLIRLYVHEAFRVYHDRLVDQYDIKAFKSSIRDIFKKDFEDFDEEFVFSEPLIYCHFAQSLVDQKYLPLKNWDTLYQLLVEAQANYNEVVGYMNLVLFEDAMIHVCRINRILESPRGNALLIGVGGSGKQTLARLAAFISSHNVFQIQIKKGFSIQDMKEEIASLYTKVGLKNISSIFLMTDAQIPDESILMLINDLLASGEIPELFSDDQMENIFNGIRNEVKQSGSLDTKENCWRFFVDKIRRLLKVVLCFSPVGQTLRIRARKFPAILSRTSIDWFHEWPTSALESVSKKFLKEISNVLSVDLVNPIGCFMAYVHGTVNQISKIYLQNEKRYNYTTPKTFLEYIFLYSKLLVDKNNEYAGRIQRLQSGMAKLAECAHQVDALKNQLAIQEVQLAAKNAAADKLITIVSAESETVKREKHIASEEEKRVRVIEEDVSMKTRMCEEDLRHAEPALIAAQDALNTLNKNNLTELKSFGSPPKAVVNVCAAVMVLLATNGKIPKDRSWKAAKLMMGRVDQFLNDLLFYDKDNIHVNIIEELQEYLKDPEFNPDKIVQKSVAAAGLCAWIINIHRYHQVFLIVGPKQKALQDSQDELLEAQNRLEFLKAKINNLELKLSEIQAEFEKAVAEKQKCQQEADKTAFTLDLAHRLINGLANENIRWKESVKSLQAKISTLPGDVLLISSFLSYVGCFTRRYREELQQKMWLPNFRKIDPLIPHTEGEEPLSLFSDDAQIATWNNEGLPMDGMSTENATILEYSTRWPLMIDPQLQGIKWIKNRYGSSLVVIRLSQKGFLETLEKSIAAGDTVLIEQIEETMDTVLEPLLSRALIKKGRYVRIGDKEIEFNQNFRLLLHTKLANPHYKPEMQAQTTLINFTVTPDGLEEQLLAEVVKIERPDLEEMKTELTVQQNKFKISLKNLEDDLLARLASAGENVLDDHALVMNLEATKRTVDDIEKKVQEARTTTSQIDETRNIYRNAAKRAAILYFVLTDLSRINPIYKFSLKSFMSVFRQAIALAPPNQIFEKRVTNLVDSITFQTYRYTLRGLFEADKLIFSSHMTLRVLSNAEQVPKEEIDFLLRYPHDPNTLSPLDFIGRSSWGGIKTLTLIEHFYGIDKDIESYTKRWRKFLASDTPEKEQFPGEWKQRTALQKLCIIRALRPDRMTYAIRLFIDQIMGPQYANAYRENFAEIFQEVNASIPIFFVLSPGVDPIRDVERLAATLKRNDDSLVNISLGQGQEVIAEQAIEKILTTGSGWIILQNVHLVVKWLPYLEKLIERLIARAEQESDLSFRLFISAEPAPDPQYHIIPQGILESSLKIVNEPPSGMASNLHKAWDNFNQDILETCTQEAEFKSILFALCYFHAVTSERRKFGPQGWNKVYPFNFGDLSISANVLHNYLEGSNRIPWEDLRYLFGEIMYGGHITDDWDRRLCQTYLEEILQQELVDGDFELCPGFPAPPNLDFEGYHSYINEMLPNESPALYGLHPNAEIGFLTAASEQLLKTIFELQPRESELSTQCNAPREELVKIMIDDFLDKLQDEFNLQGLLNRVERKTPFVVVALQECERMNSLICEIKRSLRELMLGLKGELTISQEMELLDYCIFYDHVPESWAQLAYPSMWGLQAWFSDLLHRIKELAGWLIDFKLPCAIWLGGLFNPQSFLTAIMQESARKHDLPLDRMCLNCDVTKKRKDDVTLPPIEGAFIHALYLDGASWDCQLNSIVPLHPKELLCSMPVIYIKSIVQEKQEQQRCYYECPLYKTRLRGPTFVWTFNLKTRERPAKWILGGVALLLQP